MRDEIMKQKLCWTLVVMLALAVCVNAQDRSTRLPPDDPELYFAFIFFVDDFSKWLEAQSAAQPARRSALVKSAARYLHVDERDFPKIALACQGSAADLRRLGDQARQYWQDETHNNRQPDPVKVGQLEAQRRAAIEQGVTQMQRLLSKPAWRELRNHINGEHRERIQKIARKRSP
jgi:hypothetical protein